MVRAKVRLADAHTERTQRVVDRVRECGRRDDDRCFARAAEPAEDSRRRLAMDDARLGHVTERRDAVVEQRRTEGLTLGAVDELLEEGHADRLREATVD